jgi:hypothetical protein
MAPMYTRILRNTEIVGNTTPAATCGLLPAANATSGNLGGMMMLMKGAIPSTPTLGTMGARASDILIKFRHTSGSYDWNTYSVVTTNPISLTSQFVAATASGTVSWFWWVVFQTANSPFDDANPLFHQVIGTVGVAGSGADLEMVSTSMTAGELYRIANLKISFPSIWTY